MNFQVASVNELRERLKPWVQMLEGSEILLLEGPLGAGKTTFVHALVELRWDVKSEVASPTYALHHQYVRPKTGKPSGSEARQLTDQDLIDHWDLFRIESLDELDAAGFWDILNSGRNLWIVEWPQRIDPSHRPEHRQVIRVRIEVRAGGRREIEISSV